MFCFLSFAGLVVLAGEFYPIPFRTRPSKPPAPMVLRLKPRESRSLPVLLKTENRRQKTGIRTGSFRSLFSVFSPPIHPAHTNKEPREQKCSRGFLLFSRARCTQTKTPPPYSADGVFASGSIAGTGDTSLERGEICEPYFTRPSSGVRPGMPGMTLGWL